MNVINSTMEMNVYILQIKGMPPIFNRNECMQSQLKRIYIIHICRKTCSTHALGEGVIRTLSTIKDR